MSAEESQGSFSQPGDFLLGDSFEDVQTDFNKCDGNRPVCKQCQSRNAICHFGVLPGETRTRALRRKLETARAAADTLDSPATPLCSNPSTNDLLLTSSSATQVLNYDHATDSIPQAFAANDTLFELGTLAAARESDVQSSQAIIHPGQVFHNDESSNMRLVLDALVSESNAASIAILARLRAGEEWAHVAQSISGQRTGQARSELSHFAQRLFAHECIVSFSLTLLQCDGVEYSQFRGQQPEPLACSSF